MGEPIFIPLSNRGGTVGMGKRFVNPNLSQLNFNLTTANLIS